MHQNLLIVESPAKAKTINKYLGENFRVLASYGHVRDLVPKEGAVDPDSDFAMRYEVIDDSSKHVDAIVKAARKADALYLATDLDREGEAISWHVREILRERGVLDDKPVYRVVFSEITRSAIEKAVSQPRELSDELVNAQQARRALDYLVGFNLSPLLWKKLRRGLSAGRVQSPALRLIVEREEEIEAFEPQEYWTIAALLAPDEQPFEARLYSFEGEKVEQFRFPDERSAHTARQALEDGAAGAFQVTSIKKRERRRRAAPPFITSTLQQDASRKLGFSASRTMRIAQQLYEGVEIDGVGQGLITYMRTDSVHLATEALHAIRDTIGREFGADQVPEKPNFYKTKAKNAQEAHEAIRPTDPSLKPKSIARYLQADQRKLYELIWKRAVASQMKPALYDTVSVDLACGEIGVFRASGSILIHPGFLAVYEEGRDSDAGDDSDKRLPPLKEGQQVKLAEISADQHFTEPPPRFSEASLVKALEEFGIGRPSTYASIIGTLVSREYVELDRRRFMPTDIGRIVSRFLSTHFSRYVDYEFTAKLEDQLDAISRGEQEWVPVMRDFWDPFDLLVREKEENVSRAEAQQARQLGTDPATGRPVSVRMGRYGPYVQLGDVEDDEKPKFAGLTPGKKMDKINLDEALELFKLPRNLGETADGEEISVNIGRYGPYVRFGSKFASIPKEDDPFRISRERALELIEEKKRADRERIIASFDDGRVQVLKGRYGPFVTDGEKNASVPKDSDPAELDLAACEKLLETKGKPVRRKRSGKKAASKKAASKKAASKKAAGRKAGKKAARKKAGKKTKKKTAKKSKVSARSGNSGASTRAESSKPAPGDSQPYPAAD